MRGVRVDFKSRCQGANGREGLPWLELAADKGLLGGKDHLIHNRFTGLDLKTESRHMDNVTVMTGRVKWEMSRSRDILGSQRVQNRQIAHRIRIVIARSACVGLFTAFGALAGGWGCGRGFELAGRVRGERRGERRKARTTADPSSLRLLWMTMQWWVGFAFMGLKASGACGGAWGFAGGEGEQRVLIWLFWEGRICGGERGAGRLRWCGGNDEKHASGAQVSA